MSVLIAHVKTESVLWLYGPNIKPSSSRTTMTEIPAKHSSKIYAHNSPHGLKREIK
jgi:hypothetical protein